MSRGRSLALVALLLCSAAAVAVGPASGNGIVTVSTETAPERPAPGENVTITTTITNPEGGSDTYSVGRIEIRETDADDSKLYNYSDDLTAVDVGETVTRDLSAAVEESGEHTFVVHMQLLSGGQVWNIERTVTVTAGRADPALSLSGQPVGPSGETAFTLNVSNPRSDAIRSLSIDLASDSVTFDEDRRIVSQLGAGQTTTLQFPVSNVDPGTKTVTADVEYTTADGRFVSTTTELGASVDRIENPGNVTLSGVEVRNVGSELRINGQVDNVGGTSVSSVSVAAADEADSLGEVQSRTFIGAIDASGSTAFDLAVATPSESGATTIPVAVSYRVDGERVSRTLSVAYEPGSNGDVSLSGVDVVTRNGESQITGRANNVGDTNVSSLRIAVPADAYSLGEAQSRTFVGNLAPSASQHFDVAVSLPDDAGPVSIPVAVSYRVDGERVSQTTSVTYDAGSDRLLELTGVRVETDDNGVTVRGSVSNLGTANASAVVVSAGQNDAVSPANARTTYFVGPLDQSDFKSFRIDARLADNTTGTVSIPVEVSYRSNGQRVTQTIDVTHTLSSGQATAETAQRNSSAPIVPIIGVVLVVIVGALGYYRYR